MSGSCRYYPVHTLQIEKTMRDGRVRHSLHKVFRHAALLIRGSCESILEGFTADQDRAISGSHCSLCFPVGGTMVSVSSMCDENSNRVLPCLTR